jgi:putative chitinase
MSVTLTTEILVVGCGCSQASAEKWLAPMQAAMDKYKISDSPSNVAALLANVGVECAGLTRLSENLYYSAARLAVVWPQRYAVDPHSTTKIPNNTAVRIANNPQATANNVYANRMGNGDENSGDGYKYRAQGPIELTGRAEFLKFFANVDMPLNSDPAELQQPGIGSESAAWFFVDSGASEFGAQGNFDLTVERVNGQAPCEANQGSLRQARYKAALPLCSAANIQAKTPKAKSQTTPQAQQ